MENNVKILGSSSKGNAILYFGCILVDCGVTYATIKPHIKDIKIVLLTHEHKDHINITTLKKMQSERPAIRFGCCMWMLDKLDGLKNIDIYGLGAKSAYTQFSVLPFKLYHDVPNCGYVIEYGDIRVLHATDTAHLQGIVAKDFDIYCIESNYDEDTIWEVILEKDRNGQFAHERGSINSHLSEQQCNTFFYANKKESSILIRLHESSTIR